MLQWLSVYSENWLRNITTTTTTATKSMPSCSYKWTRHCKYVAIVSWILNWSLYLYNSADLHHDRFQRVFVALPGGPSYSAHVPIGFTTLDITPVQIALTTCFVPPSTFLQLCTVIPIHILVVVFGTELHSEMVRQWVTFDHKTGEQ